MSTGMRKWMEKGCPDIPTTPAEVSIGREELRQLRDELAQYKDERDALRAKVERMEKQEPVAWGAFYFGGKLNGKLYSQCDTEAQIDMYIADRHQSDDSNTFRKAPLYALPGAQPAPSVPMDVIADYLVSISAHLARRDDAKAQAEIGELLKMIASAPKPGASVPEDVMRDAERYRYLRARDDGTAGVGCWIEADGRVCDRGWLYGVQLDSAIDSCIEVLAAAPKPEAKP